jgi:hypothetical protein
MTSIAGGAGFAMLTMPVGRTAAVFSLGKTALESTALTRSPLLLTSSAPFRAPGERFIISLRKLLAAAAALGMVVPSLASSA